MCRFCTWWSYCVTIHVYCLLFLLSLLSPCLPIYSSLIPLFPSLPPSSLQKHQAYVKQFEVEKVKIEHEERKKTMGAEVKQHQKRAKFEDQLARRRYEDQLSQQVLLILLLLLIKRTFCLINFIIHTVIHEDA